MKRVKTTVRSALVWALVALTTLVAFPLIVALAALAFPFDRSRSVAHRIGGLWARGTLGLVPGWYLHVTGLENVGNGPYVIVANHESMGDGLVLYRLPLSFKWVSKRSVFWVPLLGWAMWFAGYIPLVRGDKQSIGRMMRTAESWVRRGVSVLLFPEGTRSRTGDVGPFKLGAFRLAIATGTPILPVSISGTRAILRTGDWRVSESCHMRVHVDPPIPVDPVGPEDAGALAERVRAQIVARKARLGKSVRRLEAITPRRFTDRFRVLARRLAT